MERFKKILRRCAFWAILIGGSLLAVLLLLEFLYRFQVIDFYKAELNGLNPAADRPAKTTVLVMGDSFTADQNSWMYLLTDSLPEVRFINSAVPGTGIIQATLMARKRFRRFNPQVFVYQVYPANDLFDIRYPAGGKAGFGRKLYWFFANRFRVLGWMNYAAGKWKAKPADAKQNEGATVSTQTYNQRELTNFAAEPALLRNSLYLRGGREADFETWQNKLNYLLSWCEEKQCKTVLLFIPHQAQVSQTAYARMKNLGCELWDPSQATDDYPFVAQTRSFLKDKNVILLNPLEFLRNHPAADSLYYLHDPHLTPRGQQVLGKWVLSELKSAGVFP